jgi:acyl-CoA synthetase (NDP forming)
LLDDPGASLGAVIHDRGPVGAIYPEYVDYLRKGHEASGKPVFLVANRQGTGTDPAAIAATREGMPVLDGVRSFLTGVRCLLSHRDFAQAEPSTPPRLESGDPAKWRARLAVSGVLDESEAAAFLADLGLPINPGRLAATEASVKAAAQEFGFPVVLKTAESGIIHKSDKSGVKLNLIDEQALIGAYREVASKLGPEVLVSPMITEPGVEMMIGMLRDQQFGPLVVLGFGGVNIEAIDDVAYALPPFDAQTARRLVDSLRLRRLLNGERGQTPAALDAFCDVAAQFSAIVAELGDVLEEVDLNPVIVNSKSCIAVDALVVGNAGHGNSN